MVRSETIELYRNLVQTILPPPPDLTVSEWADAHRILSKEASAESGRWVTDRAPFQRGIMDAVTDNRYEEIVIMSSAQVGKSELLLNTIGYHIAHDPASILLIQPTLDKAEEFSKERVAPMIRDTPVLRERVADPKARDSGNTVLYKSFPGGYLALGGANAPAGLASRPIRILLADEVDRFPISAGKEGDPLALAEKRTTTFHNKKIIKVSTPTNKGTSRIEREFEKSTQDYYHLPCPSCGHLQSLKWPQISFESVAHACIECGALHGEFEWKMQEGQWISKVPNARIKGFHLNELLSPWKRWKTIIQEFKEAKDNADTLKVWVNTTLGETWDDLPEQDLDDNEFLERAEEYGADIPNEVKILTAAVDTQDDRFEVEVIGWGEGRESWGIIYEKIHGDLNQPDVWERLDQFLSRTWTKANGERYGIAATFIDSGGHHTQEVYRFTKERVHRRIFPIKGKSTRAGDHDPLIAGHSRPKPLRPHLIMLGVNEGKRKVINSLHVSEPGPLFCHFPKGRGYDKEFFEMLTAEQLVVRTKNGQPYQEWVKIRKRNEALDIRVYALAALEMLNPNLETGKTYPMAEVSEVRRGKKRRRRSVRGRR